MRGIGIGNRPLRRRASSVSLEDLMLAVSGRKLRMRPDAAQMSLTGTAVDEWNSHEGINWLGSVAPVYVAEDADFNGHPSVQFVPIDRLSLETAGELSGASGDHTFIAVHKSATANDSASHVLFASGQSGYGSPNHLGFFWSFGSGNQLGARLGGGAAYVSGATQTTDARYDTWQLDDTANTLEIFEDGVSAGTSAYGATNILISTTKANIGSDVSNIRHYRGKIAELLLWNRKLSGAELATVWAYIADRYGI